MKRSYIPLIRISIIVLIFLAIIGYGLFQARNLLRGPEISISSPINGASYTTAIVMVAGMATNITHISLDDRPIFVDKLGNFSEKLLLAPGYNIIKLEAQDKFGRSKERLLELNYAPVTKIGTSATSTSTIGTSTVSTSTNIIQ